MTLTVITATQFNPQILPRMILRATLKMKLIASTQVVLGMLTIALARHSAQKTECPAPRMGIAVVTLVDTGQTLAKIQRTEAARF